MGTNIGTNLEPFSLTFSDDCIIEDDLSTHSFLERLIVDASNKIGYNVDEISASAIEDFVASSYLSSENSFVPENGEISSEDVSSVQTLQIASTSFDSFLFHPLSISSAKSQMNLSSNFFRSFSLETKLSS